MVAPLKICLWNLLICFEKHLIMKISLWKILNNHLNPDASLEFGICFVYILILSGSEDFGSWLFVLSNGNQTLATGAFKSTGICTLSLEFYLKHGIWILD